MEKHSRKRATKNSGANSTACLACYDYKLYIVVQIPGKDYYWQGFTYCSQISRYWKPSSVLLGRPNPAAEPLHAPSSSDRAGTNGLGFGVTGNLRPLFLKISALRNAAKWLEWRESKNRAGFWRGHEDVHRGCPAGARRPGCPGRGSGTVGRGRGSRSVMAPDGGKTDNHGNSVGCRMSDSFFFLRHLII